MSLFHIITRTHKILGQRQKTSWFMSSMRLMVTPLFMLPFLLTHPSSMVKTEMGLDSFSTLSRLASEIRRAKLRDPHFFIMSCNQILSLLSAQTFAKRRHCVHCTGEQTQLSSAPVGDMTSFKANIVWNKVYQYFSQAVKRKGDFYKEFSLNIVYPLLGFSFMHVVGIVKICNP